MGVVAMTSLAFPGQLSLWTSRHKLGIQLELCLSLGLMRSLHASPFPLPVKLRSRTGYALLSLFQRLGSHKSGKPWSCAVNVVPTLGRQTLLTFRC